jgi:hypothetical protein
MFGLLRGGVCAPRRVDFRIELEEAEKGRDLNQTAPIDLHRFKAAIFDKIVDLGAAESGRVLGVTDTAGQPLVEEHFPSPWSKSAWGLNHQQDPKTNTRTPLRVSDLGEGSLLKARNSVAPSAA